MSMGIPVVPALAPPPREIPFGVVMHVLNRQRLASSPMWTIPALSVLLLAAIGQPVRGARVALVVFGAALLFMGLARTLPTLRGSLRTLFRMRHGSALLGRIGACRSATEGRLNDLPYAEFLRKWPAVMAAAELSMGLGCLLGVFVLPMAFSFIVLTLAFIVGMVVRLFQPSLIGGDIDYEKFEQFCVAMIGMCLLVWGLLTVWRKAKVPMAQAYLNYEMRTFVPDDSPQAIARMKKALAEAADIGLGAPLPSRSQSNQFIACKVEFEAFGAVQAASGLAAFSENLNLAGFEPLLFHPRYPGEVDLFAGLPMPIRVSQGRWDASSVIGAEASVFFAAAVAAIGTLALLHEVAALSLGR